jgi:hypothetical protein
MLLAIQTPTQSGISTGGQRLSGLAPTVEQCQDSGETDEGLLEHVFRVIVCADDVSDVWTLPLSMQHPRHHLNAAAWSLRSSTAPRPADAAVAAGWK